MNISNAYKDYVLGEALSALKQVTVPNLKLIANIENVLAGQKPDITVATGTQKAIALLEEEVEAQQEYIHEMLALGEEEVIPFIEVFTSNQIASAYMLAIDFLRDREEGAK